MRNSGSPSFYAATIITDAACVKLAIRHTLGCAGWTIRYTNDTNTGPVIIPDYLLSLSCGFSLQPFQAVLKFGLPGDALGVGTGRGVQPLQRREGPVQGFVRLTRMVFVVFG